MAPRLLGTDSAAPGLPSSVVATDALGNNSNHAMTPNLARDVDVGVLALDKRYAGGADPSGVADSSAAFAAAVVKGSSVKDLIVVAPGTFRMTAPLDAAVVSLDDLIGVTGHGKYRTTLQQVTADTVGVIVGGRGQQLKGLSIVTATPQMGSNSIGVLLADGSDLIFAEIADLYIDGFNIGLSAPSLLQFNNTIRDIRVAGWYAAAFRFGLGSGSLHQNLYASAVLRTGVYRMLESTEYSGEFVRLNLEQATVRADVIFGSQTESWSFNGLHMEGLSLIGSGTTALRSETVAPFLYRSSGRGTQTIRNWTINTCHLGAYIVSGLTHSGSTATATVELMSTANEFTQKAAGGHGIEVGDTIFVAGANEADYNGSHPVTAVTGTTVAFTISGTPATPATVLAGSDCITLNLGNAIVSSVPIARLDAAGELFIDGLFIRDMRIIHHTPAGRQALFRLGGTTAFGGKLRIRGLRFGNERSNSSNWIAPIGLVGYSRTSNVATIWLQRPHNLRPDNVINVLGATDATFDGKSSTLTIVNDFAVSYANTGADVALTSSIAGTAYLEHRVISNVVRTSDICTLTTSAAHTLAVGCRVAVVCSDNNFNTTDALVLSVPTTTTFTYRKAGANIASAAATGTVMLIEAGIASANGLLGGTSGGALQEIDWLDRYCTIFAPGLIAAATAVGISRTIQDAQVDRCGVEFHIRTPDDSLTYKATIPSANVCRLIAFNPTAGGITPAATPVFIQIRRT